MPAPLRILIPLEGDDPNAWAQAVGFADAIAERASASAREIILLTHTKDQLRRTSLSDHMGEPAAKALLAGRPVGIASGRQLRHATLQTLRGSARGAVVVAYYADDSMLEKLDGLDGLAGVVAVPWVTDQVQGWTARWNPIIPGQEPREQDPLIDDPVIVAALTALSGSVNLAHGVMHPRDKDRANETLRILRAKGHALEADRIKTWAIRNGWKPGAADELARLAGRVAGLKAKPSLSGYHDPHGRYERWKV